MVVVYKGAYKRAHYTCDIQHMHMHACAIVAIIIQTVKNVTSTVTHGTWLAREKLKQIIEKTKT